MSELIVDLDSIKKNILCLRKNLKNGQKFCAVVKANAYGLGAKKVCKSIKNLVDCFAVSCYEEFLQIKNIIDKPIIILDPIYKNITKLARFNAEFCVSNFEQLNLIKDVAKKYNNLVFKIHIAFNTGMNRFGFNDENDVLKLFTLTQNLKNIIINGIFSHYYLGENAFFDEKQYNKLLNLKEKLSEKFNINNIFFHIANSDGFYVKNGFDMVRIGMAIFSDKINSTLTLKSKLIEIQNINIGDTVGYSRNFIAKKNMKVGVVQIGYADGVFRSVADKGYVLVNGVYCKILAVCMDSIIIDITGNFAHILDDVILIGKSHDKQIFICDLASWCDTIGYEIITKLTERVKRKYIEENVCKLSQESIEQENLLQLNLMEQDQHLQE